jgi:hypothetical protein
MPASFPGRVEGGRKIPPWWREHSRQALKAGRCWGRIGVSTSRLRQGDASPENEARIAPDLGALCDTRSSFLPFISPHPF